MEKSLFVQYIEKLFPQLGTLINKINGKRTGLTYLHKTMLRKEYSADQKWESASVDTTFVSADMVSMDSALPAKKRDSIAKSNGVLPKIGMKRIMSEKELNQINMMKSQEGTDKEIASKLAKDPVACSTGIDEKNEANFLEGLSNGMVVIGDIENPELGTRVDFNYPDDNIFGVGTKGKIEYEDIKKVLDFATAKGSAITTMMLAKSTYDKIRNTRWAKELSANYQGQVFTDGTALPTPTASRFNDAVADDNGGIKIIGVYRSVIEERNGKRTVRKPWNADKIVFLTSENVGALVWGTLAEKSFPSKNVEYTTVDGYKLISKFSTAAPFREITMGQALCLPVIENVDQIFTLDIADVEGDAQTEGDDSFSYDGATYNKEAAISAYNEVVGDEKKLSADVTDAELLKAINGLSKANEAKFKAALAGE